jgi:thiol-disulfide isomerase/thioredoxin
MKGGKTKEVVSRKNKKHTRKASKMQKPNTMEASAMVEGQEKNMPVIIGLVHAKGCPHCDAMEPAWDQMTEEVSNDPSLKDVIEILKLEKNNPQMNTKINEINQDLVNCQPLVINGYPTMFCKKEHYLEPYNGGREKEELMNWVRQSIQNKSIGQMGGKRRGFRASTSNKKNKKSLLSYLKF